MGLGLTQEDENVRAPMGFASGHDVSRAVKAAGLLEHV
jgi:hypothetical protein